MTINESICKSNGLSIGEALLLIALINKANLEDAEKCLVAKGYITATGELFSQNKWRVTQKGVDAIETVLVKSDDMVKNDESRYIKLAEKLRELYPAGRKDGTAYMWRGTVNEVAKKLQTLVVKYKFIFTDEEAIKATQSYINSFNGDYRFMQLLKYFILKSVRDADGNVDIKSEFMSRIENAGQEDALKDDWMSTLS